jgi:hypothetical protein
VLFASPKRRNETKLSRGERGRKWQPWRKGTRLKAGCGSWFFQIARVLVRVDHAASFIVNADDGIM